MELVFCTNNDHKIREVTGIMGTGFHFLKLADIGYFNEIPEPFDTLEANSAAKANTVFLFCGKNCFAEDTGLFVEALNGEPGVYSARYAGEGAGSAQNIEKLMKSLQGKPIRRAGFKTVITLTTQKGEWQFTGVCGGRIAEQVAGREGFGYDPVFIPDGYDITFAEMDAELKNNISHRKKAFVQFADFLTQYPDQ